MIKPSAKIYVTPALIERFNKYHYRHCAWGSLHIVLDDFNLEDQHVKFCIQYAKEQGDTEGAELGELLLQMSETQRAKVARLA